MFKMNTNIFVILAFMIMVRNSYTTNWVKLKSTYNEKYVCAENSGKDPLIANRERAHEWEIFEMINNADDTVSFRSFINNRYVCAENAANSYLIANRDAIGPWEKFNLITMPNANVFGIQSIVNQKYVSVADDGQLIANSSTLSFRASFIISPNWVTIKSNFNKKYVCADKAGTYALVANRDQAHEWETFELIYNDDKTVTFRSRANSKYVSVNTYSLLANRIVIGKWEKFNLTTSPYFPNLYGIQSILNGKYLSVQDDPYLQVYPIADTFNYREAFEISPLETFDYTTTSSNKSALGSTYNDRFVGTENDGTLIANQVGVNNLWEFYVINNYDGTSSFLSAANGKYVCAKYDFLIANSSSTGPWEKFSIKLELPFNSSSATIRSIANGKYVSVADNSQLTANADTIDSRTYFTIYKIIE